jgi:dihydrofolate reductase
LRGDIPSGIAELKQDSGGDFVIMGSGRLIRSLLPGKLIDEYLLMIHPIVFGSGQRLFDHDNNMVDLKLIQSEATRTAVIIAVYQPN